MNKSFENLNDTFNMDNDMEDIDLVEEVSYDEVEENKPKKQKYNLEDIELMKTELQCKIERETNVAEEMRQSCKVGCPPRMYEIYAKIEQTISDDIMRLHDIEKTIAELQIVEEKEKIKKEEMALRQQNTLLKIEKSANKGPSQLIQNNTTINMSSTDQLHKIKEKLAAEGNSKTITDINQLPQFILD